MKRVPLRGWRVSSAEPSGLHVWFDPKREALRLYELEPLPEEGVHEVREGDDAQELVPETDQVQGVFEFEDLPF